MSKEKKEFNTSTHHILPRSRGGSNNDLNLINIRDNYHRAIHTVFANKMIAEQLITTVGLSAKALRKDTLERLLDTLMAKDIRDPYEWYKDDVIK